MYTTSFNHSIAIHFLIINFVNFNRRNALVIYFEFSATFLLLPSLVMKNLLSFSIQCLR